MSERRQGAGFSSAQYQLDFSDRGHPCEARQPAAGEAKVRGVDRIRGGCVLGLLNFVGIFVRATMGEEQESC